MDLKSLIETHLDVPRLSKDLDELGHWARVWSVDQWSRRDMATLWEACRGFRPVSLDDLVPPGTPPLVEVVHDGKNTLPAHTHFQKRICRPSRSDPLGMLFGYNHQSLSAFSGPGYFVVRPSAEPGEVEFDYTLSPTEKPLDWPEIVPNRARFGRFVYEGIVDVVRGLASHVCIGRLRKGSAWMDTWFVLVREDAAAKAKLDTALTGTPS
ncbi:MAG TPA: hypothetical protein VE987_17610 [Polyangiaceae bacterium]|nr:hypothetical protein [Polyangiaceae bacterium]